MITEAIYLEIVPFKKDLEVWCVEKSTVPSERLRALGAIWQRINNNYKELNYGCRGCVDSFMRDLFNLMRGYENTISK